MAIGLSTTKKGSLIVLSNNNLTFDGPSGGPYGGVVTTDLPINVGKLIYYEVNIITAGTLEIGVIDSDFAPFSARYLEYETTGKARFFCSWNGSKGTQDGTSSYSSGNLVAGDVIGVAVDLINYTITFYKNGVNLGVAYSDLNTLNGVYPAISTDNASKVTVNFGATNFKYAIPNGYDSLDHPWYYSKTKTDINSITNIGDCIKCRYTATTSGQIGTFSELGTTTSNPIPVTSSATPDGSFYWIYVGKDYEGRMKLIADRNIQNSISWDTLNAMGMIYENKFIDNLIPTMTSNTSPIGIASANQIYSSALDAYKLFDKSDTTDYASPSPATLPVIVGYEFNQSNIVNQYKIIASASASYSPKSWVFEGSIDGTNWTTLDIQNNITSWGSKEVKIFNFTNTVSYKKYRLNINAGNSTQVQFSGLSMHYINKSNLMTVRLLTGGTSSSDTDDEWDNIIVNSTLNNTITAGDNNVWNWNGIYSWTSTTPISGSTYDGYKILRGYLSVSKSYSDNGFITSDSNNIVGFRPILLVESIITAPVFSGNLLSSSIHTQDAILTGSITDTNNPTLKVQYKILLNDTQIYPESGFTDFMDSPTSINYNISNSLLTQTNNKITIIINNEQNKTNQINFYATIYNNVPNGILNLSDITTHNNNINLTGTITDTDLDQISYRILINDSKVLPWSTFVNDPYIDYIINASDLNIGDNKIEVDYKDNFKNQGLGTWSNTITKTNQSPIINIQYINGTLIGNITDADNDPTQYRILINGTQVYPSLTDYTDLNLNGNINYQVNRNDILFGKNNIITVYAKDSFNALSAQETSFIGDYIGLMFMDENKQFYTTDIGELLKYLDFGTITLGTITEPVKILVQNKFGFSIKDITLNVINSLPNITVEFSKENNPFISTNNLVLENTYNINDMDYFYIRLNTSISPESVNGTFMITAKATSLSN